MNQDYNMWPRYADGELRERDPLRLVPWVKRKRAKVTRRARFEVEVLPGLPYRNALRMTDVSLDVFPIGNFFLSGQLLAAPRSDSFPFLSFSLLSSRARSGERRSFLQITGGRVGRGPSSTTAEVGVTQRGRRLRHGHAETVCPRKQQCFPLPFGDWRP